MPQVLKLRNKVTNFASVYDTIKPLYYPSRFLQIWPFKFRNNEAISLSITDKITALFAMLLLTFYIGWSTYGKIVYAWNGQLSSPIITDVMFTTPVHCFVIYSMFVTNFKQSQKALEFFEELHRIDNEKLFLSVLYYQLRKSAITKICITYIITALLASTDFFFLVILIGYQKAIYFTSIYVDYYLVLNILLQVSTKADVLRQNFKIINQSLQAIFSSKFVKTIVYINYEPKEIRALCKIHIKLTDLMDIVSEIHGLQTALLFCCVTSLILLSLNYALWAMEHLQFDKSAELPIALTIFKLISALIFFCPTVMLVKSCSSAAKEGIETGNIAHALLSNITVGTTDPCHQLIKDELNLIIQQASQRRVHFSASGFFPVDFTLIYGLIAAVTSYFIVLMQFKGLN